MKLKIGLFEVEVSAKNILGHEATKAFVTELANTYYDASKHLEEIGCGEYSMKCFSQICDALDIVGADSQQA